MANLLLAGYFGSGNLGDDAILLGFVNGFGETRHHFTVLSGAPEETYRYYGLTSVPRMDNGKVSEAISKCDALVFAGGSIFQDVTSVKSVGYYSQLVSKAKKAGKRVIMVGQGVGPLDSFFGKRMAQGAFNSADVIVVRDPHSMTTLKALDVKVPIKVSSDLAFLLPDKLPNEENNFNLGDMKTVGISLRPWGKDKKGMLELFGGVAKLLFQAKMMPVLIEMDKNHDGPMIDEISKKQGGRIPDLRKMATPMNLQARMARMDAVIAMRLHAGILATTVGVPPLMVSYDPKVAAFAKMMDMGNALPIEGLTAQRLFDAFMSFHKDRDRNTKIMQKKKEELRTLAQVNIQVVEDIMGAR